MERSSRDAEEAEQDASQITSGLTCDAFDILLALFLFGEMRAGFIAICLRTYQMYSLRFSKIDAVIGCEYQSSSFASDIANLRSS